MGKGAGGEKGGCVYIHLFRFLNLGIEEYEYADEDKGRRKGGKNKKEIRTFRKGFVLFM